MKTCSICGLKLPIDLFYRDSQGGDGFEHRCKACTSKRRSETGHKRKPPSMVASERAKARKIAVEALRKGILVREPCFTCGAFAEMHHVAYSSPLLVTWLCRQHHRQLHCENPPAERAVMAVNHATGERKVLPSMAAGLEYGFQPKLISLVCNGHKKSHAGWVFSFVTKSSGAAT